MIRFLFVAAFILFSSSYVLAESAEDVQDVQGVSGVWKSQANEEGYIYVQIGTCEESESYCGTIIKAFDLKGKSGPYKFLGKKMLWDMKDNGDGQYLGGKIFAPDRERVFDGELRLDEKGLVNRGCSLGGLVCKEQQWSRVPEEELKEDETVAQAEKK